MPGSSAFFGLLRLLQLLFQFGAALTFVGKLGGQVSFFFCQRGNLPTEGGLSCCHRRQLLLVHRFSLVLAIKRVSKCLF